MNIEISLVTLDNEALIQLYTANHGSNKFKTG